MYTALAPAHPELSNRPHIPGNGTDPALWTLKAQIAASQTTNRFASTSEFNACVNGCEILAQHSTTASACRPMCLASVLTDFEQADYQEIIARNSQR